MAKVGMIYDKTKSDRLNVSGLVDYYESVKKELLDVLQKGAGRIPKEMRCAWLNGMSMCNVTNSCQSCKNKGVTKNGDYCIYCIIQQQLIARQDSFAIYCYSQHVRNGVLDNLLDNISKTNFNKKEDYPACSVACWYNKCDEVCFATSGKYGTGICVRKKYVKILEARLNDLDTNLCKNAIGCCAEPHAADKVLRRSTLNRDMALLEFSVPIRPRTMEVMAYCANCQTTFDYCKRNNPKGCYCGDKTKYKCI